MNDLDRAKELKRFFDMGHKCAVCTGKSKQLKEKIEKGCGGEECKTGFKNRHVGIFCNKLVKCKDCQETLKILNEILGVKNE